MQITDFSKDTFSFPGNWRAIVEDNDDPLGIGRVKVRIIGIHSLDPEATPVEHLPWAEPCLSISYSGGQNINNKEQTDRDRYVPVKDISLDNIPSEDTEVLNEKFIDNPSTFSGSGGIFTTPRKGTHVWVFFEGGDHNRPHFWSSSTKGRDWIQQKTHLIQEIQTKRDNIREIRDEFDPDNNEYKGNSCSENAAVKVWTNKPKLEVFQIDKVRNHYITSQTSDLGVTTIFVNEPGKERMYLIHKGYMEYVDENGQRKILVGTTEDVPQSFEESEAKVISELKNDKEETIANNYELHVIGDFDIFVKSSTYIQCEKDVQINAKRNIGIVSREADIDIICDKADINTHTKGSTNINADGKVQIHSGGDTILKTDGDLNWKVGGKAEISATEIIFDASQKYSIKSPQGFHVDAGGKFKVDSSGFGANVPMNAPISNARHTGCFPGPGAGPSTPFPSVPSPFSETRFEKGTTQKKQEENPPAVEETDRDGQIDDAQPLEEDVFEEPTIEPEPDPEITEPEPTPEPEDTPTDDDFDDRLEDQLDNADEKIEENRKLEEEADKAKEAAEKEKEKAEKLSEHAEAVERAKKAEDALNNIDDCASGADTKEDVDSALANAKANNNEDCASKLSQASSYMAENGFDDKNAIAAERQAANDAAVQALEDFNALEVDDIDTDVNSDILNEANKLGNKDKNWMDRTADSIDEFNRDIARRSQAIQNSIQQPINKAEALKRRCQARINAQIRARTSFTRRILNNPTASSSLRLIDSSINTLHNARRSILGVSNSISNVSNRIVGLTQINDMIQVNAGFNSESFIGLNELTSQVSSRTNSLTRGIEGLRNIDEDIKNDLESVSSDMENLRDRMVNNINLSDAFSINLDINTSLDFANAQEQITRGFSNVSETFRQRDPARITGGLSTQTNTQLGDLIDVGTNDYAGMQNIAEEILDTCEINEELWQDENITNNLRDLRVTSDELKQLSIEGAAWNLLEDKRLEVNTLLQQLGLLYNEVNPRELIDDMLNSFQSDFDELQKAATQAETCAFIEKELNDSINSIQEDIKNSEISLIDGSDSFLTLSFGNLQPDKLGLTEINRAIYNNPSKTKDFLEDALAEVETSRMIVDAIKDGITDEENDSRFNDPDEFEDTLYSSKIPHYSIVETIVNATWSSFEGTNKEYFKYILDTIVLQEQYSTTEDENLMLTIVKNSQPIFSNINNIEQDNSIIGLLSKESVISFISFLLFSFRDLTIIDRININFEKIIFIEILNSDGRDMRIIIDTEGIISSIVLNELVIYSGEEGTTGETDGRTLPNIANI